MLYVIIFFFFFFQAEDGIRDRTVTGVQTCALPISLEDHRHVARPFRQEPFERADVHVSLERMDALRLATFRYDEVDGLRAGRFDVRARGVEMGVVRNDLAGTGDD